MGGGTFLLVNEKLVFQVCFSDEPYIKTISSCDDQKYGYDCDSCQKPVIICPFDISKIMQEFPLSRFRVPVPLVCHQYEQAKAKEASNTNHEIVYCRGYTLRCGWTQREYQLETYRRVRWQVSIFQKNRELVASQAHVL